MAQSRRDARREVAHYAHADKERLNNPPVGLVTPDTDRDTDKKTYAYDPHLDPQLGWAGKAEHTSFEVPTVSLHVHERIDPRTIIEVVKKPHGSGTQLSLFATSKENLPIRQAIEFYKHKHNWSNRLIAGDSLLVMNSLLEKEGMAGQVQMVYIDPPYGIRYGSNFQPFVSNRNVKDGKDDDLTQEPEMIRAFRDTWELGIHSYLTYMHDRLLLAKELLHESGSIFVQINDENVHLIRCLMDEVFGTKNLVALIPFAKTAGQADKYLASVCDFIIWYTRDIQKLKYRQLFINKVPGQQGASKYEFVELADRTRRRMTPDEQSDIHSLPSGSKVFSIDPLTSQEYRPDTTVPFTFEDREFHPGNQSHWKTSVEGLRRLAFQNRLLPQGTMLRYVRYLDDFPVFPLTNLWPDIGGIQSRSDPKIYVVQTSTTAVQRCLLMTTDPGDLVLDTTCANMATTSFTYLGS